MSWVAWAWLAMITVAACGAVHHFTRKRCPACGARGRCTDEDAFGRHWLCRCGYAWRTD